jgi:hypothetical protein
MNFFITSRTKSDKQWKKKKNIFFIIAHFSKQYNQPTFHVNTWQNNVVSASTFWERREGRLEEF